jgi:hypothetical protein
MIPTWTIYFIENVVSRRVFIYHRSYKNSTGVANGASQEKNSHSVVVLLEKVAQSDDGFRVGREATEEVDKVLVAHAGLDKVECSLVQRRVHGGSKTSTGGQSVIYNSSKVINYKAYMAAILMEGVGGFSKTFSSASYAVAPVCTTA